MSVITYDQTENPLIASVAKLHEDFVSELVSEAAMKSMAIAAFKHGEACKSVLWSPNWQQQISGKNNFPTGFQFTVDPNSPVVAPLFPRDDMFAVQMAFPLAAGARSASLVGGSGTPVDEHHFVKNSERIASLLNRHLDDEQFSATNQTNFSGIFATETRTAGGFEQRLYAVARFSSAQTSGKVYDKIQSAKSLDAEASAEYVHKLSLRNFVADPTYVGMAPPHTTWRDLFVGDHEMLALRDQQEAACASVLLMTIRSCGLGSVAPGDKTELAQNIESLLRSPELVKTTINVVDHTVPNGDLAFLSEMTSIHSASNGVVFREAPTLGITLYGKASSSSASGEFPAAGGVPFIGLPCNAGQVRSTNSHNSHKELGALSTLTMRGPFVWDASGGKQYNTLLSTKLFRKTSSDEWFTAARKIGLVKEKRDVVHLKPVIVKMATTSQPWAAAAIAAAEKAQ